MLLRMEELFSAPLIIASNIEVTDSVNTTDAQPANITFTTVNDAPVNTVPTAQNVNEDTNLVFSGVNAISISDADAGTGPRT